jgi:hypothetical protein
MNNIIHKKLLFTYCHGGGGSWLGNLIWHLHHNDFSMPSNQKNIFDGTPSSTDYFNIRHAFDYFTPLIPTIYDTNNYCVVKFGSEYPFQLYLNEIKKIRYLIFNIDKNTLSQQFDEITNTAKGWMTDQIMHQYYCKDLDLDIKWVYTDPEEFIKQLFAILDTTEMPYSKNIDYCLASIENYKSTCYDPKDHIGNLQSITWLAWCHALIMVNKIQLPAFFDFTRAESLEKIADAITPVHEQCLELSKPWYFLWKENE